jgi:regulator of protease activity HflC (stomatin/prohibitin superfamily)
MKFTKTITKKYRDGTTEEEEIFDSVKLVKTIIIAAVVIIAFFVVNPISCIGPAERGIQVIGGQPQDTILLPGINFHVPVIGKIQKYSIGPNTYDLVIDIANRGAVSKDNQIIGAEGKIVWNFDANKIDAMVKRYPNRDSIENIIKNTAYEALKTVIGKYSIYDLPGNMALIGSEAFTNLKQKLTDYPIEITQFNVTNFDWSDEFDKRINDTMAAQQKVREMEQQAAITEQQSKQQVIQAEAQARALIAEAEGKKTAAELNAQALIAEAQGKNEANRLVSQNQSVEWRRLELEIQLERAKRWDGREIPTYLPLNPAGGIVTLPAK